MRRARAVVAWLVPVVVGGCGQADAPAGGTATPIVTDSAGVQPVESPASPGAPAVATAATARRAPGLDSRGRLTMDSLGVLATYGLDETAGPNAVLQRPLDAAFLGEHVLVLDASPPWVRRFERDGRFDTAWVRQGEGPGEAMQPYALAATESGFLFSHRGGLERFGATGELLASMRGDRTLDGAVECGGVLLTTGTGQISADFITTRALTRRSDDGALIDTLAVHRPARHSTRLMWTWFADARDGSLLLYTEEENRARLERRSCTGDLLGELPLDSIGPGLVYQPRDVGFTVFTARTPHPSGFARVLDRTLWAARGRAVEGDSVTTIEAFDAAGAKRRLVIDGWYQIFDADAEGRLLLGNSWTLGFNWEYGASTGDIPAVLLVDGVALIAAIDAHGEP